ncbi:signal recognition particle receptor subunit alpha homolog [Zootermopsis nevadensis]|uniref:Signal recognition particle receptor subunit alpha n=1 Tax=Zootermopsis nevadensis TaxID=136037 RepID=A0A067QJ19_ZOONE|nr:signal recognition particle receptor subunit alpha homolog [Zootermopsis nevadensis]KDR08912.1 Signal recognition particle receptor subunit alpha [Zootermopsis nevadensis]
MLDLFTIFSKGGIVLWCFQSTSQIFTPSVNALIRSVILQERTGNDSFEHNALTLKYKLDNEFELVFVVAYQKILQLSYVDKLLNDIHLEFRDKYKTDLQEGLYFQGFEDFGSHFRTILNSAEQWGKYQSMIPKQMRTFEESSKSKKTVASMIERKNDEKENKKTGKNKKKGVAFVNGEGITNMKNAEPLKTETQQPSNIKLDEETLQQNRLRLAQRMAAAGKSPKPKTDKKSPKPTKEGKKPRVWDLGGNTKDLANLDYTKDKPTDGVPGQDEIQPDTRIIGSMAGGIRDLEVESDSENEVEYEEEGINSEPRKQNAVTGAKSKGVFSLFRGLVGSKNLTHEGMQPVLDKLKDHLIAKNVATDIAHKLCDSVAAKLEGKVLGTFDSVATTVRTTLTEALVQILSPKRRVDILRDAMEAKKQGRPYVMTFCGVNGVGKSTNLAKICFWLIENNLRVLIAACDTFRAGAVEQLRTHTRHLNALHPSDKHGGQQMVQLYEKGYGKDAAGIAMEAINFARDLKIDVVLVDTAGRMQDNEPLMRALAKLIKVNQPDLVLFVGEALVGNEAVDQLVKFNQAIADYSSSFNPQLIDGIVLTKFDTIDDKVGAAISMTYITGQPIVFVGTGQTYTDLKSLNAKAVVHALMK